MASIDNKIRELRDDFELFSTGLLKIKNKAGELVPFALNEAQRYIYQRLEDQIARTGMVRAVILKGRQQGCSTFVTARFFHKTVLGFGKKTYILTHEQAATDNLFAMTQRYLENYPEALRPELGAANAKELVFTRLDSGYKIATAGNRGAGRSATAQFLHGSEAAYWPAAQEHLSGIMQTIPMEKGTEIILESTANGIGNVFHEIWKKGVAEEGGWQAIFVPWYWQQEYRVDDATVSLTDTDIEYGSLYDLDRQQIAWRRYKINEMGDERLFMREYPSTPAEAFSVSDDQSLITGDIVAKARKVSAMAQGAKVIGVDPARFGNDKTVLTIRQGRVSEIINRVKDQDTMQVAGIVVQAIKKYQPRAVFIDLGGLGAGIVDRLRELGFSEIVHGVNFGGKPLQYEKYFNKRAEMWGEMKAWLAEPPVQIHDDDDLEMDLCGLHYSYDSLGRLKLESKEEAKKRGIKSPDAGDSLALTFAMPVNENDFIPIDSFQPSVRGMGY